MPLIFIALLLFCAAPQARAADDWSEEEYAIARLEEKLRQHPEVAAYAARAESYKHYAKGELGLPDPTLFVQEQDYPVGGSRPRGQEQKTLGFRQEIPAIGARGAKSARISVEAKKNRLLADYAFAAMKARMIAALANIRRIKEQEKLLEQQAALLASGRASIKGRLTANLAASSRISENEADGADIEIMRAELAEEKHENTAMLMNMLGEAPDIAPPVIQKVSWDHDGNDTYPVAIAAADVDMAKKDVDLRESEFNPNVEIQADYGRMDDGYDSGTFMLGLSIPLWASDSQAPRLEGAKSAALAAESDLDMTKRQTAEKLSHLETMIETSSRKIGLLEHKISLLRSSGSAQVREYEAGKADFSMPLKAKRDVLSAEYQLVAERAKLIALIADFNRYIVPERTQ